MASRGAAVVAIARRAERLDALRAEFSNIVPATCDVTDHDVLEEIVSATIQRLGKIDALVNNAGFSYYERLTDSSLEHWRETMAVNVESMFVLAKLVAPHMIERRYGRIVNVSSVQAQAAEPVVGAYAASKGAINAWSRSPSIWPSLASW